MQEATMTLTTNTPFGSPLKMSQQERLKVFLCHVPKSRLRRKMKDLCYERWEMEWRQNTGFGHPIVLTPESIGSTEKDFQRDRRIWVDSRLAKGEIYVLTDDDCLLAMQPVFQYPERILSLMTQYGEFGILSMMPTNADIYPWRPENREVIEDEEVMEHISVGGIRICVAGCLDEWPESEYVGYDQTHCAALREAGWRVGYMKNIPMNHLGEGYSTVWS
jgi:hypothetical protein